MELSGEEDLRLDAYIRRIDQAAYERLVEKLDVEARLRQVLAAAGADNGPESESTNTADLGEVCSTRVIRQS
ncbi:hypothetical protein [Frankia sp. CiP3]|uniref:hypothetical protein n=1 Tax=Frankia sp. CiP3 TaxID=2880971 RepID=UPI001EF5F4CB|nr:hypothetical protein [Frankia sp. CiP3]